MFQETLPIKHAFIFCLFTATFILKLTLLQKRKNILNEKKNVLKYLRKKSLNNLIEITDFKQDQLSGVRAVAMCRNIVKVIGVTLIGVIHNSYISSLKGGSYFETTLYLSTTFLS